MYHNSLCNSRKYLYQNVNSKDTNKILNFKISNNSYQSENTKMKQIQYQTQKKKLETMHIQIYINMCIIIGII